MKQISELLQIMLDNIDSVQWNGLYNLNHMLYWRSIINWEEKNDIKKFLHNNTPFTLYMLFNQEGFWWKPYKNEPRKRWLRKQIKKLKAKGL